MEALDSSILEYADIVEFRIPEFSNCKLLGSGAQAHVLKGTSDEYGEVAIKYFKRGEEVKEIEILKKIPKHPNIIQLYGPIQDNKSQRCLGFVMELMPLGSLHEIIHNITTNYNMAQIENWVQQICLGLGHLHKKNIIHRDLKPSNILVGPTLNKLKISDFGSSKIMDLKTNTGGVGTSAYMAPEVIQSQKYGKEADIYGLTITIWEIIHRKRPYGHLDTFNNFQIIQKILDNERPQLKDTLDPTIADILRKCCCFEIEQQWKVAENEVVALELHPERRRRNNRFIPKCMEERRSRSMKEEIEKKPIKCVVIGDGYVGKSMLIIWFATGTFEEWDIPTVFERFEAKIVHEDVEYDLELWDTSGGEGYGRWRPLSYSGVDVFLVCFNVNSRVSFDNVMEKWKPEAERNAPGIPIVLVGTQTDIRNPEHVCQVFCACSRRGNPVSEQDGAAMAQKIGAFAYRECSAHLNEGIQEVFTAAVEAVNEKENEKRKAEKTADCCCVM